MKPGRSVAVVVQQSPKGVRTVGFMRRLPLGSPLPYTWRMGKHEVPQRILDLVLSRIERTDDGCWLFNGALTGTGYGHVGWSLGQRRMVYERTHRIMYEQLNGPVPEGLDLDHTCHDPEVCQPDNSADCPHRRCCNPEHLEAVSRRENLLRGGGMSAKRAKMTECGRGHPFTEENTHIDKLGRRNCRICRQDRYIAFLAANPERRREYNRRAWAKHGDRHNAERRASRKKS